MAQAAIRRADGIVVPREILALGGFAAAIAFVAAAGAGLASLLPAHASMWMSAGNRWRRGR
jgi:hypothetical protein